MTMMETGFYYPEEVIQVPNPLARSLEEGDPITAMGYDLSHQALYVAMPSQPLNPNAHHHHHHHYSNRGLQHKHLNRASMLLAISAPDDAEALEISGGGGVLYSSVAGHPEALPDVLNSAYQVLYGSGAPSMSTSSTAATPSNTNRPATTTVHPSTKSQHHVPSHAYRPPYGATDPAAPPGSVVPPSAFGSLFNKKPFQKGTSALVPLHGHCATASLSGVRLHQLGGFVEADLAISGALSATLLPAHSQFEGESSTPTHMAVGGLALSHPEDSRRPGSSSSWRDSGRPQHLRCLDLWEGLKTVTSYAMSDNGGRDIRTDVAVTALASVPGGGRGTIVAGCTDRTVRLLDSRLREVAKIKSHMGGVVNVAASDDGTLLATTGYGSRGSWSRSATAASNPLYSFPDPSVLIYDIRYLGRGGIPHPFAGARGGPRFLSFIPDITGHPTNRLAVASGQEGGGLQIMTPFQDTPDIPSAFIQPPLERGGCITSMCLQEDNLSIGTSNGMVLRYRLSGYDESLAAMGGVRIKKEALVIPPFEPRPPALSLDASLLLQTEGKHVRIGATEKMKSIVSTYVLCQDPSVSVIGDATSIATTTFGPLAARPMLAQSRNQVSASLLGRATHAADFLHTIPAADLHVNLMDDHRPDRVKARSNRGTTPLPNPNKFLYSDKLFRLCYEDNLNRNKRSGRRHRLDSNGDGIDPSLSGNIDIPTRYRLTLRPTHKSAASFNHHDFNETRFVPGWDYPPTMPNSFVPPVLMLFYMVPELRSTVLTSVHFENSTNSRSLLPELAYLFHRIDSLGRFALISAPSGSKGSARVGAWAPSNFISSLATMPETEQLQILDGSPAAVDPPRRPEAFYRFLLYQVDKEASKYDGLDPTRRLDVVGGIDFVSINEFISGSDPLSHSMTRSLTVDLYYEGLEASGSDGSSNLVRFADVLQRTLCRESRLRAWSQGSKSYETIVQRKIATSLPTSLSLSCACTGRKVEEGLVHWRSRADDSGNWLPEMIEVELLVNGSVVVREFVAGSGDSDGKWIESSRGAIGGLPEPVAAIVSGLVKEGSVRKRTYRLEAVLSIIRDDMDRTSPELLQLVESGPLGHLVLHTRIRNDFKRQMLVEQIKQLEDVIALESSELSLLGPTDPSWSDRLAAARTSLGSLPTDNSDDTWVLINGFIVSNTTLEDATNFSAPYKEPSLLVYCAIDDADNHQRPTAVQLDTLPVSPHVMNSLSLTDGSASLLAANQRPSALPGSGEMVAFDAEFVSLQEEEASLTDSGSKVVVRETRYAVARVSLLDCRTGSVILDDHVHPREPVVDCLTRFSGIVPKDLDPKESTRHLITTRAAYLKLRHLVERGCIFVGHGLLQDFWTVNLAVPARQIVDTVEIYHKPAQRYVSLRFLANFVLKRDMQREVHDSVEDAVAAFELYRTALERKEAGTFDKLLDDLYEYGNKNDWKLGVDEDD